MVYQWTFHCAFTFLGLNVGACVTAQLKEMAERLPKATPYRHGRSASLSLARLDIPNGIQSDAGAALDSLGSSGSEGLGFQFQQFSPIAGTPDLHGMKTANGDPSSLGPLSGHGTPVVSSPRAPEVDTGSALRNGCHTEQRPEEEGNVMTSGTPVSSENRRLPEMEWVEQDEPGVYITLTALPGGGKDLKRVRFRFGFCTLMCYAMPCYDTCIVVCV